MRKLSYEGKKTLIRSVFIIAACLMGLGFTIYAMYVDHLNHLIPFGNPTFELKDWVLIDSDGNAQSITLPHIVSYGKDGKYKLERKLEKVQINGESTALYVYSNCVDIEVQLDGETIYSYPKVTPKFSECSGNSYHYIDLPENYDGKTLTIYIHGQLKDEITYQLDPCLIGSRTTMIYNDIAKSMPTIVLSSIMIVFSIILFIMNFVLKSKSGNTSYIVFLSIFATIFSIYALFECRFISSILHIPSGVYTAIFILLAIIAIPLAEFFMHYIKEKYHLIARIALFISYINYFAQIALHFFEIRHMRSMLPLTHFSIILTIGVFSILMILSGKESLKNFFLVLPIAIGGATDIILLAIGKPSFNNSMWFTIGVTAFIIMQFSEFISSYLKLSQSSIESDLVRKMAFNDALTGLGNRNAYEKYLKELSLSTPANLSCIIADINDLKVTNDLYGHNAGDMTIIEVGESIKSILNQNAHGFRTGGDEFVILFENITFDGIAKIASDLNAEVYRRSEYNKLTISISYGYGHYEKSDISIIEFIKRVDALMYEDKRSKKRNK